jgi:hypothetical protein
MTKPGKNDTLKKARTAVFPVSNEDEDEDDEDYIPPPPDNDEDHLLDTANQQQQHAQHLGNALSFTKQRAVDDAFADLFGASTTSPPPPPTRTTTSTLSSSNLLSQKKIKKSFNSKKKKTRILSDIFGSSVATQLISKTRTTTSSSLDYSSRVSKDRLLHANGKRKLGEYISNDNISTTSTQNNGGTDKGSKKYPSMKKRIVSEKKVFAGQTIEIQRTVIDDRSSKEKEEEADTSKDITGSTNTTIPPPSSNKKKNLGGIDSVLDKMSGVKRISTMDKTNIDWESFKDKTGLEDELKKKAESNDAYLVKKDFLQRVDLRRFEQEKDVRDKQRAIQQANNPK